MSALWAPVPAPRQVPAAGRRDPGLQAVGRPAARLSRAPFLLVLIAVVGLGMAGLLMLNTTLQNQAFSSRALDRQATELAYTQAALESQIAVLSAPPELVRRASALGMRPNPYPALLELPSGEVIGEPKPVSGGEVPSMVIKTPAEIAAAKAAAKAKAEREAAEAKAKAKAKAAEAKAKAAEAKAKAAEAKEKAARAKAKAAAEPKAAAEKKKAAPGKKKKAAQDEEGQG